MTEQPHDRPTYRRTYAPWGMQRKFHRSPAAIRVVVAGRQAGKTHAAAEEVVRLILARPGTTSCLLMPTYKSTKAALHHVRRAVLPLGKRVRWKEVDKAFEFPGRSVLYVRTAEDKEGVPTRGLTLDGVLWVDEAAYVPKGAWEAARLTQAAVPDPKVILTATPCGRNWLYEEWLQGVPGPNRNPLNESFRFRSEDSPFCNAEFVADLKQKLGGTQAMQELGAQFLGDAGLAFNYDDVQALFKDKLAVRGKSFALGVDLGKVRDFTVCTLMNEWGEAWVLDRWRHESWPDSEARITRHAQAHQARVVIDEGYGGGYGGAMADYLERSLEDRERVLRVKTGNPGVKAQLCEALIRDVESRRVVVEKGEHADVLRHELCFFEVHREVANGLERVRYHGPKGQGEDDHDDTVISFALANFGRMHEWEGRQGETEDLQEYFDANRELAAELWFRAQFPHLFPKGPNDYQF